MVEEDFPAILRAYRDELARRHNYDAWSLMRELAAESKAAGRKTVRFPKREPRPYIDLTEPPPPRPE